MSLFKVSSIFSVALVLVNVVFLYTIVACKELISYVIFPGLTVGILGFIIVITFAVGLTWLYVRHVNHAKLK